jgi:choline kinase
VSPGCGPEADGELIGLPGQVIDDSQGICDHEHALQLLVRRQPVEAVSVTGLPWTEVDFVENLQRAQSEIFPAIAKLEGT